MACEQQQKVAPAMSRPNSASNSDKVTPTPAKLPWHGAEPIDICSKWRDNLLQLKVAANEVDDVDGIECVPEESSDNHESVAEEDRRLPISPTESMPYNWICSLRLHFPNKCYKGTGFYCTITGSQQLAVVTCAHNLYIHNEKGGVKAQKVEIIQGRDGSKMPFGVLTAETKNLYVPEDFINEKSIENDFGLILFDEPSQNDGGSMGFGFWNSTNNGEDCLEGRIVHTCGYPGKKPEGTLWLSGGLVKDRDENRIYYTNDTSPGQSGSPIWTWSEWNFMVVGIHCQGGHINSGCRVNKKMIAQIANWTGQNK